MRTLFLAFLSSAAFAQTTSLTREAGPDGQHFFAFPGKCPAQIGSYHPLQYGKVEVIKDKDGKNLKLAFETPTASDYDRKGSAMCAYRCAKGLEPIEVDGALACVGVR